jgi:hypothetical protein
MRKKAGGALRHCGSMLALVLGLGGCGGAEAVNLFVELRTDLVPGVEFVAVRTTLESEGRSEMQPVFRGPPYLEAQRVAELSMLAPGPRTVRVDLLDGDGEAVATRSFRLEQEEDFVVTALVTRDCAGMDCSCLGGQCTSPDCVTGEEPSCPAAECTADADCPATAGCATGRCQQGRCVSEPDDAQCSADAYCNPEMGCITLECEEDADCTPSSACAVVTCVAGRCSNEPDDGLCAADERCDTSEGCVGTECVEDADCAPPSACAVGSCDAGRCAYGPDDALCDARERCDVDAGCLARPIAVYELDEGTGQIAHDTSGATPPLDLTTFSGTDATWIDGGVSLAPGEPILATAGLATRLGEDCRATDELSVAVWMRTDVLTQGGPARIVSYSTDAAERNFTLGHGPGACSITDELAMISMRLRLDDEANACSNAIQTGHPIVTSDLMHVVFTRASAGRRQLYVDGVLVAEDVVPGSFDPWTSARLLLGAEDMDATLLRRWTGELHHVAIWNRALLETEVVRLHDLGPDGFASF